MTKIQSENTSFKNNMMCNWNRVDSNWDEPNTTPTKEVYLDFDEFIEVMKDKMINEKENMQDCDIAFESESSNVSCLFWPY